MLLCSTVYYYPRSLFLMIQDSNPYSLKAVNLTYERNQRALFKALSFTLYPGQILHIVGANGSGKTSLLKVLCGLAMATEGDVYWHDMSIREQCACYGTEVVYIAHESGLKLGLTVRENLYLAGMQKPLKENDALHQLDLQSVANMPVSHLSVGQQRRAALARLLVLPARLWILDEPLTGLDQQGAGLVEQIIKRHIGQGGSVILTSHQPLTLDPFPIQRIHLN